MYFSFLSITLTVGPVQWHDLPLFPIPISFNIWAIFSLPYPFRYQSNIFLTIRASSWFKINSPLTSSYPNTELHIFIVPFSIRFFMLHRIFCEIEVDSSWARPPIIVIIISSVILAVSIFSFSKNTVIPRDFSSRTFFRQSLVFRANRLIDLVYILSILPLRQSFIILWNSSRLSSRVPVIPSSAYRSISSSVSEFSKNWL